MARTAQVPALIERDRCRLSSRPAHAARAHHSRLHSPVPARRQTSTSRAPGLPAPDAVGSGCQVARAPARNRGRSSRRASTQGPSTPHGKPGQAAALCRHALHHAPLHKISKPAYASSAASVVVQHFFSRWPWPRSRGRQLRGARSVPDVEADRQAERFEPSARAA